MPKLGSKYKKSVGKKYKAKKSVSKSKARKILKHGKVKGKILTKKQRGYFGLIGLSENAIDWLNIHKIFIYINIMIFLN